jgi:hypothetical protein
MQRLISLFAAAEPELRLSRPFSGPPPSPPAPDYDREPEYFRHLLDYLRDPREPADVLAGDPGRPDREPEAVPA